MNFINYIRDQSQRLTSKHYLKFIWDEIHGDSIEIDQNLITAYNNHLPVLLEQFWEICLEKLNDPNQQTQEIDEELKIYLLVLLYECTNQFKETLSFNTKIYASEVYLLLLLINNDRSYFKSKLYQNVLNVLHSAVDAKFSNRSVWSLLDKLREFLFISKLNPSDLEITLATLTSIIFTESKQIINDFNINQDSNSLAYTAFLSIKGIFFNETVRPNKIQIITFLFNGLRKCNPNINVTPHTFMIIQNNYRNVIKNFHRKFEEDDYASFLNAFLHIWAHPDFYYFNEAVTIMNGLEENYYRILFNKLNQMLTSQGCYRNLLKLAQSIIYKPPNYLRSEKILVNNQILIQNIIINCLSQKNDISNTAIESLFEIFTSIEIRTGYVIDPLKAIINSSQDNVVNTPTMLKVFQTLLTKKSANRMKIKQLQIICLSLMLYSEVDYFEKYCEIFELISEDASPFELKAYLPLLSELYLKMNQREQSESAKQVLKFIFKMALHPMATSNEFVKYLYMAMICNNIDKRLIKCDLFINPIISNEFNYKEFFHKCHTINLIKTEHVFKLIKNLNNMDETELKLLCAIIHLTDYDKIDPLTDYIADNFNILHNHPNLHYLLYLCNTLLKKIPSTSINNYQIVITFLKYHLLRQNFRWNAIPDAFALLKSINEIRQNGEEIFVDLKKEYDHKLFTTLQTKDSYTPLIYFSQLVLFGNLIPNEVNFKVLTSTLESYSNNNKTNDFNPRLWLSCLILYTNICLIKNNFVDNGIKFLESGLKSKITTIKFSSLNLLFDLSNMITHNFEKLIDYMFKEVINDDIIFKRTCLEKIDRLLRDNYLKLNLEQYLLFIFLLGDQSIGLNDFFIKLLSEHFLITNSTLIAKYYLPLIVHINSYNKHPIYCINSSNYDSLRNMSRKVSDRQKLYLMLIKNLPIKLKFNIITNIRQNILERALNGTITNDEGYWDMLNDAILIYKLISLNKMTTKADCYKRVIGNICKHILNKSDYNEQKTHDEYHKEITQSSITLIKFLFTNDTNTVQKHLRIPVFDALMHWTDYFLPDLVYLVHGQQYKEIQASYQRLEIYFRKNCKTLLTDDEEYLGNSSRSYNNRPSPISGASQNEFHVTNRFLPDFNCL